MRKMLALVAILLLATATQAMAKERPHGVMVVVGDRFVSGITPVSGEVWVGGHGMVSADNKADALNVISILGALKARPAAEWKQLPAWARGGAPQGVTEAGDLPGTPGHCTTSMRKLYVAPDDGDIICPTAGTTCTVETCTP